METGVTMHQIRLLCDWMLDENRQPAQFTFTAGPLRCVAYAFEDQIRIIMADKKRRKQKEAGD